MTTKPYNQVQHKTVLGILTNYSGTTIHDVLYIQDYTGHCVTVRRDNMSEDERKRVMMKCGFFSIEVHGTELYYRKYVECDASMYKLLQTEHKQRLKLAKTAVR